MRTLFMLGACLCLAACGGSKSGEASNNKNSETVSNRAVPAGLLPASMGAVSGTDVKRLMHERHEGMESTGKAMKAIHDELQKSSPDLSVVRAGSQKIASLSEQASGWFHAGTGPEAGNTGAKAEIWQNPHYFQSKLKAYQAAAGKFDASAKGSDIGVVKAALGPLGDACKACHDKYRSKMHH